MTPKVIDKLVGFENTPEGDLVVRHTQHIPDEFVSQLKRDKIDTLHTPMGEFYRVASVPVVFVEKWKKEGFDIHKESAQAILARLRKEQLDAFITTTKRI